MEKTPRDFIFDNLLSMSAYWACTGAIIASLTAYYGFSLALSNVVTGLSGTLPILQLAGGLAYERTTRPLRFLRLCNGTWRVLLPLVFFSVLLPRTAGAPLMVVCYVLAIGIYQFACPSQTDWLVSSVEGRVRGDYYSVREMFFMLTYTGVFCAVSLIIDRAARHGAQQTGFLAVGVLETMLLAASLTVLLCTVLMSLSGLYLVKDISLGRALAVAAVLVAAGVTVIMGAYQTVLGGQGRLLITDLYQVIYEGPSAGAGIGGLVRGAIFSAAVGWMLAALGQFCSALYWRTILISVTVPLVLIFGSVPLISWLGTTSAGRAAVEALAAFGQFLAASPWNAAAVLLAMGAAFFALSWLLLRRAMIRPAK